MRLKIAIVVATVGTLVALASPAAADGDATKGATVFKKCAVCHSDKDMKNKVGPSLMGVVGRPVASIADYKYSDAMKKYAETGGTWSEENLNTYLMDPKTVVPGGKMAFAGLKKDDDRADVIAYLKTLAAP